MQQLNLPPVNFRFTRAGEKVQIFDVIRKKFVALTPEEWVRQHFVHFLIQRHHYPASLIRIETGIKYNRMNKRTDITVFDRSGERWMVVECKAPDETISQNTLDQASLYNASARAPFLVVTNGLDVMCFKIDWVEKGIQQMAGLPEFDQSQSAPPRGEA